ncbi:C-signal-like isoform X2 [Passer domesticus]|uniref:C-signal-like isoform X2 n=1 Tax=Passer domesticus TaxID=48849 RepID=UPI0030FEA0FE
MRIQGGRRDPRGLLLLLRRGDGNSPQEQGLRSPAQNQLGWKSPLRSSSPTSMLQEGRTRDTVNLPSIQRAMQAVGYHLKDQGLNLLINNAGISSHATLCSLDSQEMLNVFATNVVGPLQVVKEFLPLLEQAAKGAGKEGVSCSRAAVINISSKLGSIGLCLRVPEAPMYPYRASKAAQNMVTRCLAAELQDKGILCVAIHPGWVKTDMGTEEAPLTVEHSVRGILTVLASLSQDTSGAFLDWEGNSLPW